MRFLGLITVPPSRSRSNATTGAAILDLGTLGGHNLNTKIRFHIGGTGGNDWTIAAIGDSALGDGVSITVNAAAKTIVIHYESTVSTVAQVEAAIAALAGDDLVIVVDLAGTGATILDVATDNFAATHLAGGAAGAFSIPDFARVLRVQSTNGNLSVEFAASDVTTAARGVPVAANTGLDLKPIASAVALPLAVWNADAGSQTLRVWLAEASH